MPIRGPLIVALLACASSLAVTQAATAQAPAATPAAAPATQSQQLLKAEEIDALVAPIALYSDTLLAEVLMASTYPLEVVAADRWATQNKSLKGAQLKAAVDKQSWDDSIKSLCATPSVLNMMSTQLDWTQKLGDAVLAQQADVMDAIQRLRTKAQAQGKLTSNKQQKVSVKQEQSRQTIVIEPAEPNTIYVPYYDPAVVYGDWPYPAYPPVYWPAPGYIAGTAIATGLAFGAGFAVGAWAAGGNFWGGGLGWGNNNINIDRSIDINRTNNWTHNSIHRHGVAYKNTNVAAKFANNNIRGGTQNRLDFRGHGGQQVLNPDRDRGNIGGRDGDRPNVGDRDRGGADRSKVGDRGGGDRSKVGDRGGGDRSKAGDRGGRDRPQAGDRGGGSRERAGAAQRPSGGGGGRQHDHAFGNIQSGKVANLHADRGRASVGSHGGGISRGGGGGIHAAAGGGHRGGGGGHRGGGGGRRR